MNTYIFTYHGHPNFDSKEEGSEYMSKYRTWYSSIEGVVVEKEYPCKVTKTVSHSEILGVKPDHTISGIALVQATSIDQAMEFAKLCPHIQYGEIDVSGVMNMEIQTR